MHEIVIRFCIGGLTVSFFALLGDLFQPKSFAGLFEAAPSVALASLLLTVFHEGTHYATTEARSMIIGAVFFLIYACLASFLMLRRNLPALRVTLSLLFMWLGGAIWPRTRLLTALVWSTEIRKT
jgi:Protein of unknown function (DUF3147)